LLLLQSSPIKKRVHCSTEEGVEREREGIVERGRGTQALGAWGEKHPSPGARAQTAFPSPKNNQIIIRQSSHAKQNKKIRCSRSLLLQYGVLVPHTCINMNTNF
jgi:hypothetical protein